MFILLPIVSLYIAYCIYKWLFPTPRISLTTPRWVLITGCDTGFGASLAKRLHDMGYSIVAACLTPAAVASYEAMKSPRMLSIQLDVTKEADIAATEQFLCDHVPVLHALVNNAGIGIGWMCDATSMSTYRRVCDVNLFGGIAMTKMCIPFLLAGKESRVVNVTSMAGLMASPGMSAYCISKYGMEAFTDCFRREMACFGLKVSLIEPGFMSTPLVINAAEVFAKQWDSFTDQVKQRWGREYFDNGIASMKKDMLSSAENPELGVDAMCDAVTSTQPYPRYRPGWGARLFFPLTLLPGGVQDWLYWKLSGSGKNLPAALIVQREKQKQG